MYKIADCLHIFFFYFLCCGHSTESWNQTTPAINSSLVSARKVKSLFFINWGSLITQEEKVTIWSNATQVLLILAHKPFLATPLMTQNELNFRLREVGGNQHSCQLLIFTVTYVSQEQRSSGRGITSYIAAERKKTQTLKIEGTNKIYQ